MNLTTRIVNIFATIAVLSLSSACSKANQASECAETSQMTIQSVKEVALDKKTGEVKLIVKVGNVANELQGLREELVKAHADAAGQLGKITIMALSGELISLSIPNGSPALELLEKKLANKEIVYAEPDYETFSIDPHITTGAYNDPDLKKQWAQQKIDTYSAWRTTQGDRDVIVAVVDTGVDYTHKDLQNNMWRNEREVFNGRDDDGNGFVDDVYGYDFANGDGNPMADDAGTYHGTHVAGTIAASLDNSSGGAGIAPRVRIMALKYLGSDGSGRTSNAIRAIDYAIRNGAKIINNSWGSFGRSQALQDEIEKARRYDVLFVAAAGNGDANGNGVNLERTPFYPAAFPNDNVISVAATDINDNLARWSNYGATRVHVAAPGVSILSTRNGNSYAILSGTSMATPAVSGVLALIRSANRGLSYSQAKRALLNSVDSVYGLRTKVASGGRINAARAVQFAYKTTGSHPLPPAEFGVADVPVCKLY